MNPNANSKASVDAVQLEALFPGAVILRSGLVRDHFALLAEAERSCVTHAVESRRAEFSTGRILAADGLRQLGFETFPLKRGSYNEPLWPPGVVGSISHSSGICVVALARSDAMEFVGIDVESSTANVKKIGELIMTPGEYEYYADFESATFEDQVRITFCAKEAIFKAIFPSVARFIDFQEVALDIDADSQSFVARACNDNHLDEILKRGVGKYMIFDSVLISSFFCEAANRG